MTVKVSGAPRFTCGVCRKRPVFGPPLGSGDKAVIPIVCRPCALELYAEQEQAAREAS